MTNICRCGTYQRIRAAVHLAAGTRTAEAGRTTPKRSLEEIRDEKDDPWQDDEPFAPQVPGRFRGRGRRPRPRHSGSVRDRVRRSAGRRFRSRGQCVGGGETRQHLRDPNRALGDGSGHAHGPRPARRRGARMRLEEGGHRVPHPGREPGAEARVGRDGHRRQPRHPHVGGLRPSWWCGGADDAVAGGGQRVEGAGRRADGFRRRHHARRDEAHDDVRQGRGGGGEASSPGPGQHQTQGPEGLEGRRQAGETAGHRTEAQRQPGLRDRRQAARNAMCRDQGVSGVRRQARELRREQDRRLGPASCARSR